MIRTLLKRLVLSGVVMAASITTTLAEDSSPKADNAPAEAELLTSIFPSGCHFSGHFKQSKAMQGLPAPLTSKGDFYYSCDLGLVWHTSEPFSEAILYINGIKNFRADDDGNLVPLSGVAKYIMSNIFVRLLKGDTSYFTEEFAISQEEQGNLLLLPESETMQRGLKAIRISKHGDTSSPLAVSINVTDTTGQGTSVIIDNIQEYGFEGKRQAYEQCLDLYADKTNWCQVLRAPQRYDAF